MSELTQTILHRQRRQSLFPAVICLVGIVIASLVWQYRLRFPFDDVFITFRYADHLAAGNGLVWNVKGYHTEGYTNFLFVLLLAVTHFFTSDLLVSSQLMGVLSTIVTGLVVYAIGSNVRNSAAGILAAVLYLFTPLTWINALSGMETSVFVMLTAIAMYYAMRNQFFGAFAAAFFATLTRPEGALLGLILLVVAIGFRKQGLMRRNLRRNAVTFVLAFFLPLILYAIWKYIYFGQLLPNSFFVKMLSGSHTLFPGMQYVRLFSMSVLVLIMFSCWNRGWRDGNMSLIVLWIVALLVFYLFVLPLEGLYDRYLWGAFTMLCITGSIGLYDLLQRFHVRSFIVPAVIVLTAHITLSMLAPRTQQAISAHEEAWDTSMVPIVQELRSLPHFDSLLFAYGDAGYVVYESGIQHLDLFGLNDTRIAHAKTSEEKASIILSEKPDIMLLPVRSIVRSFRDARYDWVEDAYGLARTNSFKAVARMKAFPYTLVWVLNVNSPNYQECKTTMARQLQDSGSYLWPPLSMCGSTR